MPPEPDLAREPDVRVPVETPDGPPPDGPPPDTGPGPEPDLHPPSDLASPQDAASRPDVGPQPDGPLPDTGPARDRGPLPDQRLPGDGSMPDVPDVLPPDIPPLPDVPCVPIPEQCNRRDDDCDGLVDEDFVTVGQPCDVGLGGCAAHGTVVCFDNAAVCNVSPGPSSDERCNGLDDDCDGRVDEDFPELGLPCEVGEGVCFNVGDWVCRDDQMVCTGEPLPGQVETCNGLDDDCDGLTDQGFELGAPCTLGLGECAADGNVSCDGQGGATCRAFPGVPSLEPCNGLDDDCDGDMDNGYEGLGLPCRAGLGVCEAVGEVVCNAVGDGFECEAPVGEPQAETCNDLDDDCDGATDNFVPELPEHCGACGHVCEVPNAEPGCVDLLCTVRRCQPGFADTDGDSTNGCETSCIPTDPPDELCDGFDNDCDGGVDGPDVCDGDAFGFCRAREVVARPFFCHDFAAGSLDADWWDFSIGRVGAVPGVIRSRAYTGGAPGAEGVGGGHTTRAKIFGPALRLAYHVRFLGTRIGAGVFNRTTRPNNDAGSTGYGYTVEVFADDEGAPAVQVLLHPERAERFRASAPALADAGIHYLTATRDAQGRWRVSLDGAPLTPTVDRADPTHAEMTRVTVLADAAQAGSTLDDLVIELDVDGDGRYPPADDCPEVANPETVNADGNGRGVDCDDLDRDRLEDALDACPGLGLSFGDADEDGTDDACDGDGQALLFGMGQAATRSPWLIKLEDALRWRVLKGSTPMDHLVAASDGRLAYTGDRSIGVVPADGEAGTPILIQVDSPEWLADGRLLYRAADGSFQTATAEGTDVAPFLAPAMGEQLRIRVVRGGTTLLITRATAQDTRLEIRTLEGEVLLAPTPIPPAAAGAPFVDLHPTEMRLLLSAASGDAMGVALLDLDRLLLRSLRDEPAPAALWTPKGNAVVALEETAAGRRIIAFAPVAAAPVTLLVPANPELGDHLAWAPADRVPAGADEDGDGLHDGTDACPTHPWEPEPGWRDLVACHGNNGATHGDVHLSWDGTDWQAGMRSMCDGRSLYAIRVDARGGYRASNYLGLTYVSNSMEFQAPVIALGVEASANQIGGGNAPPWVDAAPHPTGALIVGAANGNGVFTQVIDAALGTVGARSVITASVVPVFRIQATAQGYVLVWQVNNQIWARRLGANGAALGDAVRVSTGYEPAFRPAVTLVEGTVLIAWPQVTAGNDRVYLRRYTPELLALGPAFPVGPAQQDIQAAGLAADDEGRVMVLWMEQRQGQNPRNHNWATIGRFRCREP